MENSVIALTLNQVKKIVYKDKTKSYVYVLLRNDTTPYYVGVGIRNRVAKHIKPIEFQNCVNRHKVNITKKEIEEFGDIKYAILLIHKNRKECLKLEQKFISKYGRVDLKTGVLTNLTDGGEIGPSGAKHSLEVKEKRKQIGLADKESRSKRSKEWWNSLPEEEKAWRLEKMQANKNNQETKQKISDFTKEKWKDLEYRQKMSNHSKNRWADPKYKEKVSAAIRLGKEISKANKNSTYKKGI